MRKPRRDLEREIRDGTLRRHIRRDMRIYNRREPWGAIRNRIKAFRPFDEPSSRVTVVVLLIVVAAASALSLWALQETRDWPGFALNLGSELAGAVVTYFLLERLLGERTRREQDLEILKLEMASSVNDVAVAAVEKLRRYGYLYDGSLRCANLSGANLRGARLELADLRGADLRQTNLQGAEFEGALLGHTDLTLASLEEAGLWSANLGGANLTQANLEGAHIAKACLADATLPDGKKWQLDTDMRRFTDPEHPDFWQFGRWR
jgi:hypothetical protein